jgi:hypothetical protein
MQDVDNACETDGIHGAKRVAVVVIDNLQHPSALEPPEGFGRLMFTALLGYAQGDTDGVLNRPWT